MRVRVGGGGVLVHHSSITRPLESNRLLPALSLRRSSRHSSTTRSPSPHLSSASLPATRSTSRHATLRHATSRYVTLRTLLCSGLYEKAPPDTHVVAGHSGLEEKSKGHWNATVQGLAQNVLKMYEGVDITTYTDCVTNRQEKELAKKNELAEVARKWDLIAAEAASAEA